MDGSRRLAGGRPRPLVGVLASLALLASMSAVPSARVALAGEVRVDVAPWGPTEAEVRAQERIVLAHSAVSRHLVGTRHRLLSMRLSDPVQPSGPPEAPSTYRAIIYDYTNNRALVVEGRLGDPRNLVEVRIERLRPLPNSQEFDEAVAVIRTHPQLGPAMLAGHLVAYRPMPPVLGTPTAERTLTVGLRPATSEHRHEIVAVNMVRRIVVRFDRGAAPASLASETLCSPPPANQSTTGWGEPGQSLVTVTQDGQVVWRFIVVRPASSSGTNGSGIELRYVEHRGVRVIDQAHAPILNVRYDNDTCGPFRDWLWEEGAFGATGTQAGPGFMHCAEPPRTAFESGSDIGNFNGVSIHVVSDEVVLKSELEAGWYRYDSEWRLGSDGAIRPRFGFGAVQNSCTCLPHNHHVYWRFDFSTRSDAGNIAEELSETAGTPGVRTIESEERRKRHPSLRSWRIVDAESGDGYFVQPGVDDGIADDFGVGDVWILRYQPDEIDDGVGFTENSELARAGLDVFLDADSVRGEDIVLWYGAHDRHAAEEEIESETVGPDLLPILGNV